MFFLIPKFVSLNLIPSKLIYKQYSLDLKLTLGCRIILKDEVIKMNDFIYQNATKVYFGRDQLKNLSNELKLYGNKVLITYGGGTIKKIGLFDKVVNELNESDIEWLEFGGIEPNPRIETVNAAVALCKKRI